MTVTRPLLLTPLAFALALAFAAPAVTAQETAPESAPAIDPTAPADQIVPAPPEPSEEMEMKEDAGAMVRMPDPAAQLPLEDLRRFVAVFDRIKRAYVEEVSDSELLDSAIEGMLAGLDPHSAYLKEEAFNDLEESTSGEFGGLGIEVGMEDGFIKVISPIDDTPAQRAGIQSGDLIVKLDGETIKGMSLEEAVNKMRGEPGSTITLTVVREGEAAPIEIEVERDIIKVTSIKSRMLDPGLGYVRITQFQATSGADFKKAIKSLNESEGGPLEGLVIDLRNNPGGVLQAAVEIADALINEGLLVYTDGRIDASELRFTATPGDITNGVPIVVLINGGSASASEILAGALQDHERGVIIGTQSFGKGSVQTVMPLDDDTAIKLTTARYYTPSGRSIQALGIAPDIVINAAKLTELDRQPFFSEAELAGHLSNDTVDEEAVRKAREEERKNGHSKEDALIDRDYQLRTALSVLRGLVIMDDKEEGAPVSEASPANAEATGTTDSTKNP